MLRSTRCLNFQTLEFRFLLRVNITNDDKVKKWGKSEVERTVMVWKQTSSDSQTSKVLIPVLCIIPREQIWTDLNSFYSSSCRTKRVKNRHVHPPCEAATQGFWRSLKSSVGPAVLKKPRIVVYLIYQKSRLQLLNTRRAAFLCNYNTKPVRTAFQYFDWKSLMEIAFSHAAE
jgi:hypothetical protein